MNPHLMCPASFQPAFYIGCIAKFTNFAPMGNCMLAMTLRTDRNLLAIAWRAGKRRVHRALGQPELAAGDRLIATIDGVRLELVCKPHMRGIGLGRDHQARGVLVDPVEAARVFDEGTYADAVRAEEALWQSRGIQSVPAIVIDQRYLISGGQPPEAFEQALRQIAAEAA